MLRILAIYDLDENYVTRLVEYCNRNKELHYFLCVFTKEDNLDEFIQSNEIEILLMNENLTLKDQWKEHIQNICYLSEEPKNNVTKEHPVIFKYQQAKHIIENIKNINPNLCYGSNLNNFSSEVQILSIITFHNSISKKGFAFSIAALLSEVNNTLFVPLELIPLPLFSNYANKEHSLSEFIYYLKNDSSFISKLNTCTKESGKLSYISGLTHGYDLLSLSKEDMNKWMEGIRTEKSYQFIVFYLSFYSEAMMEIVKNSDNIFILKTNDTNEEEELKEWRRQNQLLDFSLEKKQWKKVLLKSSELSPVMNVNEIKSSAEWMLAKKCLEEVTIG